MKTFITALAAAAAVVFGTAFATAAPPSTSAAAAATDRAVVKQLRLLRSETRDNRDELVKLNLAIGNNSLSGRNVMFTLREICKASEATARATGDISVNC